MHLEADHNLITDLTIGQLLGIIVTLAVIIGLFKSVNPIMHRLNDLLDDWFGESERPGVPARKGVMQRMRDDEVARIKQSKDLSMLSNDVALLRKRVEPIVDDTAEGNHQEVLRKLNDIQSTADVNVRQMQSLQKLLNRHIRESRAWVAAVDKATAERDFKTPPWPNLPDDPQP